MISIHNDPERRDLRSDVSGALSVILDNAPYGPNVDEAKVHPAVLRSLTLTRSHRFPGTYSANAAHHPQYDESD
jgi:hypothetical protein